MLEGVAGYLEGGGDGDHLVRLVEGVVGVDVRGGEDGLLAACDFETEGDIEERMVKLGLRIVAVLCILMGFWRALIAIASHYPIVVSASLHALCGIIASSHDNRYRRNQGSFWLVLTVTFLQARALPSIRVLIRLVLDGFRPFVVAVLAHDLAEQLCFGPDRVGVSAGHEGEFLVHEV